MRLQPWTRRWRVQRPCSDTVHALRADPPCSSTRRNNSACRWSIANRRDTCLPVSCIQSPALRVTFQLLQVYLLPSHFSPSFPSSLIPPLRGVYRKTAARSKANHHQLCSESEIVYQKTQILLNGILTVSTTEAFILHHAPRRLRAHVSFFRQNFVRIKTGGSSWNQRRWSHRHYVQTNTASDTFDDSTTFQNVPAPLVLMVTALVINCISEVPPRPDSIAAASVQPWHSLDTTLGCSSDRVWLWRNFTDAINYQSGHH